MSTASSIKGKQLPAQSVSIEIYSDIARFSCDSMALVPNMQALLSFSDFYHASAFTQIDIAISSVRLSVTIRYRVTTAKPIVEILSPPDSPTNLFSDKINRCSEIRTGSPILTVSHIHEMYACKYRDVLQHQSL